MSITRLSQLCEQFVKCECKSSKLFTKNIAYAWWVSSDSIKITYRDGAAAKSSKCAIGIKGTGTNVARKCNCDANDRKWREDNSLLTNKTHLSVKHLRFGDTDYRSRSRGGLRYMYLEKVEVLWNCIAVIVILTVLFLQLRVENIAGLSWSRYD